MLFISLTAVGADFSNTAVVESAGSLMVKEFELTVTVLSFSALFVCDTNVSVEGNEAN